MLWFAPMQRRDYNSDTACKVNMSLTLHFNHLRRTTLASLPSDTARHPVTPSQTSHRLLVHPAAFPAPSAVTVGPPRTRTGPRRPSAVRSLSAPSAHRSESDRAEPSRAEPGRAEAGVVTG